MSVFRVQRKSGYEYVTIANSLEDAKVLDDDTVKRLTALEVLNLSDSLGNDLLDELYLALQQLSDTVTDLKRRNPGAFTGDGPAGKLWDAMDTFLSGRWEG